MATKWSDGLEMVRACEKAKVKLFVVKQNRFNSTLQLVKRQITKGRFGKIAMVCINVFWQRPQSYYNQAEWRGTLEMDGGALMNQASHYVPAPSETRLQRPDQKLVRQAYDGSLGRLST